MDRLKMFTACALAASALLGPATANAAYLFENINGATSGGSASASITDNGPLGDSFSTGTSPFAFTGVDLLISATIPGDGGTFTVSLLKDSSTTPGALIEQVTGNDSSLTTALSPIFFSMPTETLTANTRYWIELLTNGGSLHWSFSAVNTGIGVANEYNFYAGSVSANSAFTPYQMSIGSAVPEPSTWAMMLLGFAGLGLAAHRRSRRNRAALA